MPPIDRIDVAAVLSTLKDFQRRSVDYVFDRLYGSDPTRRFLLADEVGLGKTLVARGLIAKAIQHLRQQDAKNRIDVIYICSNGDIARQNISRLNVTGQDDFQLASRLTLLPETGHELSKRHLNFISFTPATSFDFGHATGQWRERVLIYWLLRSTWPTLCHGAAAMNVLQGYMSKETFRSKVRSYSPKERMDEVLAARFRERLHGEDRVKRERGEPTYEERFRDLCQRFGWSRKHVPREDRRDSGVFIGKMREILAATCIDSMEPDLIILDEFQRFKDLLRPNSPAGALAKHLFVWGEARVLLLSATPYKMYTLSEESETDDHYKDFVETLRFLIHDDERTNSVEKLLASYGRACARVDLDDAKTLREIKPKVESELRRVMCRTEKLAVTEDRNGMLREAVCSPTPVRPDHLRSYLEARRLADILGRPDIMEFWKASPYLPNFMETYELKERLKRAAERGDPELSSALEDMPNSLLDPNSWQQYAEVPCHHSFLERLSAPVIGEGWWRLLWVPPSFPYYAVTAPFAGLDSNSLTKRLIFSSWHVVPRAISMLMSYEAERLMMKTFDSQAVNTAEERERRRPRLVFSRSDGRLTGMPVLAMLYPSPSLARLGDPTPLSARSGFTEPPSLDEILKTVATRIREELAPILKGAPETGPEDEAWYWAAPLLLDRMGHREQTAGWFARPEKLADAWSGDQEEALGWREHVKQASEIAGGKLSLLGRPPRDLAAILALMAVAGPGTCALRALAHTLGSSGYADHPGLRHSAGRIAWGLRSLFNTPEVIALIRGISAEEPYWLRVLEYCASGCLQGVLDEYIHVLVEFEGLASRSADSAAAQIAECVLQAAALRAASPGLDWVTAEPTGVTRIEGQRVRARFAMRFGDEHGEREESLVRKDAVRAAFNSPFWPFVLATTSIGQEGLDFHAYCHAVVHWNLPHNPVDLEQREGRVHRYKGHAVRKNVARLARIDGIEIPAGKNPWGTLFDHAARSTPRDSDISPYWVFPMQGGAVIERHTMALPLSREAARIPALKASLAVYRMVFGQPRQDDLVEHLKRTVPQDELPRLSRELSIDLEPKPASCESGARIEGC